MRMGVEVDCDTSFFRIPHLEASRDLAKIDLCHPVKSNGLIRAYLGTLFACYKEADSLYL